MDRLDDIHDDVWDLKCEVVKGNLSPNAIAEKLSQIYKEIQEFLNTQR